MVSNIPRHESRQLQNPSEAHDNGVTQISPGCPVEHPVNIPHCCCEIPISSNIIRQKFAAKGVNAAPCRAPPSVHAVPPPTQKCHLCPSCRRAASRVVGTQEAFPGTDSGDLAKGGKRTARKPQVRRRPHGPRRERDHDREAVPRQRLLAPRTWGGVGGRHREAHTGRVRSDMRSVRAKALRVRVRTIAVRGSCVRQHTAKGFWLHRTQVMTGFERVAPNHISCRHYDRAV